MLGTIDFYPYITFLSLIFLLVLHLYCYVKIRRFLINLVIYLFSLIIGYQAFNESTIPFTPFFQIFFLFFQTTILLIMSIEVRTKDVQ